MSEKPQLALPTRAQVTATRLAIRNKRIHDVMSRLEVSAKNAEAGVLAFGKLASRVAYR